MSGVWQPRQVTAVRGPSGSSSSSATFTYPLRDAYAEGASELKDTAKVLPAALINDPDSVPVILANIRQMQGYLSGLPSYLPERSVTSASSSGSSTGGSTQWRPDTWTQTPKGSPSA